MVTVLFHEEQLPFNGGVRRTEVDARDYRSCMAALLALYPDLQQLDFSRYMVSIDGALVSSPFLEQLKPGSEMVFIKKIAAG